MDQEFCQEIPTSLDLVSDFDLSNVSVVLQLFHFIVKEGVVDGSNRFGLESLDPNLVGDCTFTTDEDHDSEMISNTVLRSIKYFEDSVEMSTGISVVSDSYREQLIRSLDSITGCPL